MFRPLLYVYHGGGPHRMHGLLGTDYTLSPLQWLQGRQFRKMPNSSFRPTKPNGCPIRRFANYFPEDETVSGGSVLAMLRFDSEVLLYSLTHQRRYWRKPLP